MEFKNDEEVLDFITRLLERLHQTGNDQQGSHFQFVYVAPGAQHVERQYVQQALPNQQTLPNPFPSEARRPVAFPNREGS